MKTKTPLLTEEQIDEIIQNFDMEIHQSDHSGTDGTIDENSAGQNHTERVWMHEEHVKLTNQPRVSSGHVLRATVLIAMLAALMWLLPSGNVMNLSSASASSKDRDTFFQMSSFHLLSESLSEIHTIPRKYVLELSDTLTPAPDQSDFKQIWDDERQNFDGQPIDYFKDDSIEVKCWREKTNDCIFNFSEVWISDPSQLRRTLVDNVISKKHLDYPQNIFRKTNGVVGMSADYCAFRDYGIVVQYGNVVRYTKGSVLDIAVYDKNGNFYACEDNNAFFDSDDFKNGNVIHTFAFGPVLVDNYAVNDSYKLTLNGGNYPGELTTPYPRAAICQFDYDKHYLLYTLNYRGMNAVDFAGVLQSKGVRFAYNLDGGQTATLMFNGEIINQVAYGGPRLMSDILYFATAVPNHD